MSLKAQKVNHLSSLCWNLSIELGLFLLTSLLTSIDREYWWEKCHLFLWHEWFFQFWKEELPHGYRLILIQPYMNNLLLESTHVFLWMHTQTLYILLESLCLWLGRTCFNKAKWCFFKRMVITILNMTTHKIIICFKWFISFQLSFCINTRRLYEIMRHIFPWNFRKSINIFNPIISETVWIRKCFATFQRKLFL